MTLDPTVRIDIDHPGADEKIALGHYAFRIGSTEPMRDIEIRIDRESWQPCRHACGFWWYDWQCTNPGPHTVSARGITRNGEVVNSNLRRFIVL
jgi:hypothetical protein